MINLNIRFQSNKFTTFEKKFKLINIEFSYFHIIAYLQVHSYELSHK